MQTLRLYTDFVCPFCFIAEQSTVPKLLTEFELELDWCGFELNPGTPRGGRPLAELFPGVDLAQLHERTRRFGATFGVPDFSPPNRLQNTQRILALAETARDEGRLTQLRNVAYEAHFRAGADFESTEDLRTIAANAGLDADVALAKAATPAIQQRVATRQADAKRAGVRGIPTFELAGQRIVGCQPYDVLADVATRAGVSSRYS